LRGGLKGLFEQLDKLKVDLDSKTRDDAGSNILPRIG
jgi:hypothetical protein